MGRVEPWYRFAEWTLRPPIALWFNWRFEGLEHIPPEGPILVAGNHISYLDPLAHAYMLIKAGRRPRFLAKSELFANRIFGALIRGVNAVERRLRSGLVGIAGGL